MKYCFFDIECANCEDGKGKICEFGYVLTDENFNKIEGDEYVMNPQSTFDEYVLRHMLSYPAKVYRSAPSYETFYSKIKRLFDMEDVLYIGHTVDADAKYLNDEAERYHKKYFNYKFYDAKEMYASHNNSDFAESLETISQTVGNQIKHKAHRAEDDAVTTMIIVKRLCEEVGADVPALIEMFENCKGETVNGKITTVMREKAKARRLEREKQEHRPHRKRKPTSYIEEAGSTPLADLFKAQGLDVTAFSDSEEDEETRQESATTLAEEVADNGCTQPQTVVISQAKSDMRNKAKSGKFQSDIMIVKMNEFNYYVSEKIKGGVLYLKLLRARARTSTHYTTLKEATDVAEKLRQKIIDTSPDCEIVQVNFADYTDKYATGEPIIDNHGNNLGVVVDNKKIRIRYQPQDEKYRLIDINGYRKEIEARFDFYKEKEFSFYNEGAKEAYLYAIDTSLAYLRFEIYKAEELIKSFDWDKELFACDIERYTGYIDAINNAIEIQKKYKLASVRHWFVHTADVRTCHEQLSLPKSIMIGTSFNCAVLEREANSDFGKSKGGSEIFVVFADKNADVAKLTEELGLNDSLDYTFVYGCNDVIKKNFEQFITARIEKYYTLDKGDPSTAIKSKWVPALVEKVYDKSVFADEEENPKRQEKKPKNVQTLY
ncbi:MAG: hypothetical protein J6C23_08480 [Clostridia bacterium]|nr:hypothetical protein [Clostridia bacterium]